MAGGCSVEKNTGATRTFHNIVSHYNIFFNASESYKAGMRQAWKQYKPDFNKTLPVFPMDNDETAGMVTSNMDRVVKKTSKLITYHSITARPKKKSAHPTDKEKAFYKLPEYNKWVDDSYLLMGKAQYMKNDLESAAITFNYILNRFPDKKINTEARIWLMKTYDRLKNFRNAGMVLSELKKQEQEEGIPEELLGEYHAAVGNHYLLQGRPGLAIPELAKAYDESRKKRVRADLAFLLGQLYEEQGDEAMAVEYFRRVLRNNPIYDMRFTAQVRIAQNSGLADADLKEIKKTLRKLLRDEKNKEYRDQIYYAYGKVSLREGKENEAIDYFLKSAHASVSNNTQKGLSYLTTADLYFARDDYNHAQIYYDSAVAFLPPDYPGYPEYQNKSQSLNRLIRYTDEVELQDSLQHLASMSKEERLKVIDGIIRAEEEKERKAAEAQEVQSWSQGQALENKQRYMGEIARGGKWYFYNPTALAFGREEFRKRWGNRKLEDNWRRRNKVTMSFATTSEDSVALETTSEEVQATNKKSRSYYLRQIPLTDSLMAVSHEKRQEGLFESAVIFESDLKDHRRATDNLETLVKDYPDSKYLLQAFYNLYKIYNTTGDAAAASKYKAMIIGRFPDSEEAKILQDPNYYRKINEKKMREEQQYEQVYDLFNEGRYEEVIRRTDTILQGEVEDYLRDKYLFLRAIAIGKTTGPKEMQKALQEVADTVTDEEIAAKAQQIIAVLQEEHPVLKKEELEKEAQISYSFQPEEDQFMVLILPKGKVDINELKFEIINFNTDQYPQRDFSVTVDKESLPDHDLVIIKPLGDLQAAKEYEVAFNTYPDLLDMMKTNGITAYLFSEENYTAFLQNKSPEAYRIFYEKYYLR
jgi:tetratricopeptide (TPR) repeat protein